MKNISEKLKTAVGKLLESQISIVTWTAGFCAMIGLRSFIEQITIPFPFPVEEAILEYLHNFFFFLLSFVAVWLILSLFTQINPQKLAAIIFWGAWLSIFPPLIDMVKSQGSVFWSFYMLDNPHGLFLKFVTFFGNLPSGIVYFGTKIVFIAAILIVAAVVYIKTKKVIRTIFSALCVYTVLFAMGSFPSWFAFAYSFFAKAKKISELQGSDIIQIVGVPYKLFGVEFANLKYSLAFNMNLVYFILLIGLLSLLFWKSDKIKFWAVVKNARPPQLVYHTGLFSIGLGLGYLAYPGNYNLNVFSVLAALDLLLGVWLAWLASVIINDIYDFEIDKISNPRRPLPENIFKIKEYAELGVVIFLLSLLGGLIVGLKFFVLLFLYQFLAWAYSAEPYRLKKFPGVATFISSVASLLVLFVGFFLFSGDKNLTGLSWRVILLLSTALTLSLPVKDFKDIAGDKKYDVWTIPVLLGESRGRLVVSAGVFISFMLSVFLLNELRLFWWAILFGAAAFLIITNKKIKPQLLFWWILATVGTYGLILVKTVFL